MVLSTLELLYFEGCPNHEPLLSRLRAVLAQAGDGSHIQLHRVESEETARRLRFLGSPTLRVDGHDVEPGADERDDYGLKCRLYRTPRGTAGLPDDEWILAALGCTAGGLPEPWSGGPFRHRLDGCPAPCRALHQAILQAFLAGRVPESAELELQARALGIELKDGLAELQRRDVLRLERDHRSVALAYPFSGTATPHRVTLCDSGTAVFAMCAIDALGIPFLAGRPATVRSRDPGTGAAVEVTIDPEGRREWTPREAAVIAAASGTGSTAECCCPHVNFVAAGEHGRERESTGTVLAMPDAIELGRRIFGDLL